MIAGKHDLARRLGLCNVQHLLGPAYLFEGPNQAAGSICRRPRCYSDLRVRTLSCAEHLVQRIQVGLGRGDDDVGIRALAIDDAAIA